MVFDQSLKRSGKSFNRNMNPFVFNNLLARGRRNFRPQHSDLNRIGLHQKHRIHIDGHRHTALSGWRMLIKEQGVYKFLQQFIPDAF